MRSAAIALIGVLVLVGCSGAPAGTGPSSGPTQPGSPSLPAGSVTTSATPTALDGPTESATPTEVAPMFTLSSTVFPDGGPIPREFTCDGDDTSPPLEWLGLPAGTAALALVVDDPDAGGFVHWVAYNIDPATSGLAAGASTAPGAPPQGQNSFGRVGYGGPCPPSGTHHYVFRLLALDESAAFRGGTPNAASVLAEADGHTLAEARLTGTYRRGG